jgi:hypothetical protein
MFWNTYVEFTPGRPFCLTFWPFGYFFNFGQIFKICTRRQNVLLEQHFARFFRPLGDFFSKKSGHLKLLRTEEIVRPKDFFSRRFQEEPKCQEVKD